MNDRAPENCCAQPAREMTAAERATRRAQTLTIQAQDYLNQAAAFRELAEKFERGHFSPEAQRQLSLYF